MTELTKPFRRVTPVTAFEKGAARKLVVSIEPAGRGEAVIGVRLQGTRQTYRIGIHSVYLLAVQKHLQSIEKEAKRLMKEGIPRRSAMAQARRQAEKGLKS